MIFTVFLAAWRGLLRHRSELAAAVVVPPLFCTILCFAIGDGEDEAPAPVVAVARPPMDSSAARLLDDLAEGGAFRFEILADGREVVEAVREGRVAVGLVLPVDLAETPASPGPRPEVLRDPARARAAAILSGALRATWWSRVLRRGGSTMSPVREAVAVRDVVAGGRTRHAHHVAGIAVMFVLFMATGAGGALVDDRASGLTDRLRGTRLGAGGYLVGRWLYASSAGFLQLWLVLAWGDLVFDVPVFDRMPRLALVALPFAAAAASLGLLLGVVCRTREQLLAISAVVVLGMSALGGSMIPRDLMPEAARQLGLVTLNAWALDAFLAVLWTDAATSALALPLLVLTAAAAVLLGLAGLIARR